MRSSTTHRPSLCRSTPTISVTPDASNRNVESTKPSGCNRARNALGPFVSTAKLPATTIRPSGWNSMSLKTV